ncbi:hypothetical protein HGA64_04965 [Candidatus Falkowbacteria bacterium]|nr:hypothetical protein [Candidatus Falkowbacteria bacterium]
MNQSVVQLGQTGSQIITKSLGVNAAEAVTQKSLWQKVRDLIFYFGFNPKQTMKIGYYYFFLMFGWLFWGMAVGVAIFVVQFRKIRKGQLLFLLSFLCLSVILLFYYGSWDFHDNPDPNSTTLGNSYTRYWLPIYLGAIVWLALGINRLSRLFKSVTIRHSFRILVTGTLMLISLTFVLTGKDEGLIESAVKQRVSRTEWQEIIAATPENSVIISQYHDKLLFPERKVVVGLFDDDRMNLSYAKLAKKVPTYYYNFSFPDKALAYLNRTKLARAGLHIEKVKKINPTFTLYKLQIVNQTYVQQR